MWLIISVLIPIILCIILLIFFKEKVVWWEYLVILLPSILFGIILNFMMVSYNTSKMEFYGYYITSVKHYDTWDEYIHKTCSYTTTDAKGNSTVHFYDCSYVDKHPEYWVLIDNNDVEYKIDKDYYNYIVGLWNTPEVFIEMNRKYHKIDGDAQSHAFDDIPEHSIVLTKTGFYKNKIQATNSIFNFEKIDKKDANLLGLYNYPSLYKVDVKTPFLEKNLMGQNTLLGVENINEEDKIVWDFVNGRLGKDYQFRCYLLAFNNKSQSISNKQRSYWMGGNKNEFIITLSLDSLSNKIKWVETFSWSDDKTLSYEIENYLIKSDTLNIKGLANKLHEIVPTTWKRKNFKDFDYLKPTITPTQLMWFILILLVINIGISIWVVKNDIIN
jgi:energy-coupling factor transporter transmembrane protein EcfT